MLELLKKIPIQIETIFLIKMMNSLLIKWGKVPVVFGFSISVVEETVFHFLDLVVCEDLSLVLVEEPECKYWEEEDWDYNSE